MPWDRPGFSRGIGGFGGASVRTSEPARNQSAHNHHFQVDAKCYPKVQRLLDERIGPQWEGIRETILGPAESRALAQDPVFTRWLGRQTPMRRPRTAVGYSMVFEAVTLLSIFTDGTASLFHHPSWLDAAKLLGPELFLSKCLLNGGRSFKLAVFRFAPWPADQSPADRWRDCEHLYHILRCTHAHSFALVDLDHHHNKAWATPVATQKCPTLVLDKPAIAAWRLEQLAARVDEGRLRVRLFKDDPKTPSKRLLLVHRLYLFAYGMITTILKSEADLRRAESDLKRGRWRP